MPDQEQPRKNDIAKYLEQFDRSPYHYPHSPYVSGPPGTVSELKGSWIDPTSASRPDNSTSEAIGQAEAERITTSLLLHP